MENIFQPVRCGEYLFTNTNPVQAQFIQTNVPSGGSVASFAVSTTNLARETAVIGLEDA